jgi:FRG domain
MLKDSWYPSAPPGKPPQQQRRLLQDVWRLHVAFKNEQWLWRGHWCCNWDLTPGIVSRKKVPADRIPALKRLLCACRNAHLDAHDEVRLPDLALLARLQHQGAGTALLDVTTDPAVALFMAATKPPKEDPGSCCDDPGHAKKVPDGILVAIRRPSQTLEPFDPRTIDVVLKSIGNGIAYYEPPPIDHRLRIQRGAFLLHNVERSDELPLTITSKEALESRMARIKAGRRDVERVCVFRVKGSVKEGLRDFLSSRAGLTRDAIYPSAFDRPHLEQFAVNHGRSSKIP